MPQSDATPRRRGRRRLTAPLADCIKHSRAPETYLSAYYDVPVRTVRLIKRGVAWRHA
jgi:hypothetical protein